MKAPVPQQEPVPTVDAVSESAEQQSLYSEAPATEISESETPKAETSESGAPELEAPEAESPEEEPAARTSLRIVPDIPAPPAKKTPSPQQQYESLFGAPALKKVPRRSSDGDTPTSSLETDVATETVAVEEVEWINGSWDAYVQRIKGERIHVSALLQHTTALDVRDETLVLSVPDDFHKRMLGSQSEYLLATLKEFVSLDVHRISFIIDLTKAEENAAQETVKEIDPYEYMQKKRKENPVIKAIFDEFGGEMVW